MWTRFGVLAVTMALTLGRPAVAQCPDGSAEPCRPRFRPDTNLLVVLPFTVRGPTEYAYLGESMMELLQMALDGVGRVRVEYAPTNLRRLEKLADQQNPKAAGGLALEFGSARVIGGTIIVSGNEVRIRAEVYDATRDRLQYTVQGSGDVSHFAGAVDSLASALLAKRLVPASERKRLNAGEFGTKSPKALQAYLVARKEERRGRRRVAADSLISALRHDPDFGPAHYWLGRLAGAEGGITGVPGGQPAIIAEALKHSDRYPERIRMLINIQDASSRMDRERALALSEAVVARYPDDPDAVWGLADKYFHFGLNLGVPRARVLQLFTQAMAVDDENLELLGHHGGLMSEDGDSTAWWQDLARCRRFAQQGCPNDMGARAAFRREDPATIARGADSLFFPDLFIVRGQMAEPALGLALADSFAAIQTAPSRAPDRRRRAYVVRSNVALARGQFERAWALVDTASVVAVGQGAIPLYRVLNAIVTGMHMDRALAAGFDSTAALDLMTRGWLAALRQPPDSALPMIRGLERLTGVDSSLGVAIASGLHAMLAVRRGDSVEARQLLLRARSNHMRRNVLNRIAQPGCAFAVLLAQLELSRGSASQARLFLADAYPANDCVPFLGDIEETRGKIALALADTATAKRSFANVLAIWGNADAPLQPRVAAARASLARLAPQ